MVPKRHVPARARAALVPVVPAVPVLSALPVLPAVAVVPPVPVVAPVPVVSAMPPSIGLLIARLRAISSRARRSSTPRTVNLRDPAM